MNGATGTHIRRVVCMSDLHGRLPEVPECEFLVIAGDICPHARGCSVGSREDVRFQAKWLGTTFREWLERAPAEHVVACWGNHDFIGAEGARLVPEGLRWRVLTDEAAEIGGVKFWGTPWQLWFYDWAFNAPREEGEAFLAEKWEKVPAGTEVLVVHGPPRGCGDLTVEGVRSGSVSLRERIKAVRPKLVVTGHIHEGYGRYEIEGTPVINASVLDRNYALVNEPVVVEIQGRLAE